MSIWARSELFSYSTKENVLYEAIKTSVSGIYLEKIFIPLGDKLPSHSRILSEFRCVSSTNLAKKRHFINCRACNYKGENGCIIVIFKHRETDNTHSRVVACPSCSNTQLELTNPPTPAKEKSMANDSTKIFLFNDDVKAIRIKWEREDEREVPYATGPDGELCKTFIEGIEVDDLVVIETDSRHGFTTAKVCEIDVEPDPTSGEHARWVIAKVELDEYKDFVKKEKAMIKGLQRAENKASRERLREQMVGQHGEEIAKLADFNTKD